MTASFLAIELATADLAGYPDCEEEVSALSLGR
jgi:hypothetical protein